MQSQSLPPMVIFINGDLTYPPVPPPVPDVYIGTSPANPIQTAHNKDAALSELTNLQIQLFINDTITKAEFDARVIADPNYNTVIHLQGYRILVILPTFQDLVNRALADVVMFLYRGQADIEFNRFGPPNKSINLQRITIYDLLNASQGNNCCVVPAGISGNCCNQCNYPFYCDACHTFSGILIHPCCGCTCKCGCDIIDNMGINYNSIYLPNCDNIYNNLDFINRK